MLNKRFKHWQQTICSVLSPVGGLSAGGQLQVTAQTVTQAALFFLPSDLSLHCSRAPCWDPAWRTGYNFQLHYISNRSLVVRTGVGHYRRHTKWHTEFNTDREQILPQDEDNSTSQTIREKNPEVLYFIDVCESGLPLRNEWNQV